MAYDVKLVDPKSASIFNSGVAGPYYSSIYLPNVASYAKIVRYDRSNDYGSATGNVGANPTPYPATDLVQYYVRLHLNNGMHEDIKLGDLPSSPSWTNDEDGYDAAVQAMTTWANT